MTLGLVTDLPTNQTNKFEHDNCTDDGKCEVISDELLESHGTAAVEGTRVDFSNYQHSK